MNSSALPDGSRKNIVHCSPGSAENLRPPGATGLPTPQCRGLTCPDVQTTPQFLQIHRHQAANNQQLIARADANGHERLAENLRRVQANLETIIPALETLADETKPDDSKS